MPDTYTTLGRLVDMTDGEHDATWGDITDSNLHFLEDMSHGYEAIDVSLGNISLSVANGAPDQARKAILKFTGAVATTTITVPSVSHVYLIWNATTYDLIFKTQLGSGPTVPANTKTILFCDGT